MICFCSLVEKFTSQVILLFPYRTLARFISYLAISFHQSLPHRFLKIQYFILSSDCCVILTLSWLKPNSYNDYDSHKRIIGEFGLWQLPTTQGRKDICILTRKKLSLWEGTLTAQLIEVRSNRAWIWTQICLRPFIGNTLVIHMETEKKSGLSTYV
jgi:hypothetical protein